MPDKKEEKVEVIFRKSTPLSDPQCGYPGFKPGTTTLEKGSVHRKGALPLPCDIVFERDVAVPMRDGITIYIDIFRPVGSQEVPAIIPWSPYGKEGGYQTLDQIPGRMGIPVSALSNLQVWEGPDPAYWCRHGYAVVNPNARGAFSSEGDIHHWGSQDGEDGYDLIEWLAGRDWCNGRVGLTGNSWLAISQWYIASKRPPHLAAIAPWEGFSNFYRDHIARGGIPDPIFNSDILSHLYGNNRTEDTSAMIEKYPLMNVYWEDKTAELEKIDVPAYVVASYSNAIHVNGTFEGFRGISSKDKWLRVNNTMEWPDYYDPENRRDLRRFFDRYLKGIQNGWEKTPRVRLSILDPGGTDEVGRVEDAFPPSRVEYRKFFLDASRGALSQDPLEKETETRYSGEDGKGKVIFTFRFDRETELIGYLKLRLWAEARGADDMDLFVFLQKLNRKGKVLNHMVAKPGNRLVCSVMRLAHSLGLAKLGLLFYSGPHGRLRVSHRSLDPERSTPDRPQLAHRAEERLSPGEIVPVEIPIWPTGMRWHAGEQLRLIVAGYNLKGPMFPGMPLAPTRNRGEHVIHTGGRYDSHLLLPLIPR
ncbi:MAG: CocE/NonD family hydrolase [Desulfatiglandaceae bacterium]